MSDQKKIIPRQLDQLAVPGEVPMRSSEDYEKNGETKETEEKPEKRKKSGVEHVRESLRKKRKKTSFEYSKRIVDFDKLDITQQHIIRTIVDPKRIDAPLPEDKTDAEVREFYRTRQESSLKKIKDALWFLTFGIFFGTQEAIQKDLRRIRDTYDLDVLYYPGSGYDIVPRDAMGFKHVVHLSLEGQDSYYTIKHAQDDFRGYEHHDMELIGDFRSSPLKDAAVDAVLVKGIPTHFAVEAVDDFSRVLKDDGVLLFVNDKSIFGADILQKEIEKKFLQISRKGCIRIYQKRSISE